MRLFNLGTPLLKSTLLCYFLAHSSLLQSQDWSQGAIIPSTGRENILELPENSWKDYIQHGRMHAIDYPVDVTATLLPIDFIERALVNPLQNPILRALQNAFKDLTGLRSFDDLEAIAGMVAFPSDPSKNPYQLPIPEPRDFRNRFGTSLIDTEDGLGLSFSCASCHVGELFGKPVFGLQNRFPRANEFFVAGKKGIQVIEPHLAGWSIGASQGSIRMMKNTKEAIRRVEGKMPLRDGLDTSLAHVALSLSRRSSDAYAGPSHLREIFPRQEMLRHTPADSKPGNWWVLRYKNRWLADGSVLSGNPILTNILWNEIGRGTDLLELEDWVADNMDIIDELTAAVFAAKPPLYTDFFGADAINLELAQKGQRLFHENCARCHGQYEKGWDQAYADTMPLVEMLRTTKVHYFANTPVVDVGTDAHRRQGMASLEQLNNLAISASHEILVQEQKGYVPPPLVGIWARWPYFHNNSAPSLCAVLTRSEDRPVTYVAGEAKDPRTDFDQVCNGYPLGDQVPDSWLGKPRRVYDSREPGLSNRGHDEGIFLANGKEIYRPAEKMAIIEFLKTL